VPLIVALWRKLRDAMMYAANSPGRVVEVNDKLAFYRKGEWMVLRLPSGRGVYFYKPRVVGEGWRANVVCQDPRFGDQRYWGGLLDENATQATARDVIAEKMLAAEPQGFPIVAHVHDEIVPEVDAADSTSASRLKAIMEAPLDWAPGLPLRAVVEEGLRYRK
jgi:DNA polymerase